jgi:hypothetical protein
MATPTPLQQTFINALRTSVIGIGTIVPRPIKQIKGQLRDSCGGFCFLGLAKHLAKDDDYCSDALRRLNIFELDEFGSYMFNPMDIPECAHTWVSLNDADNGLTFPQLADCVEWLIRSQQ